MLEIADTQIPLLDNPPAHPINLSRPHHAAPSSNLLVRLSRTPSGQVLGRHTVKYAAGLLTGIGIMLLPFGGAGVGLLIAGTVLWSLSTTASTLALQDKGLHSIGRHLAVSVLSGGLGVGFGVLAAYISMTSELEQILTPVISPFAALYLAHIPHDMDGTHLESEASQEAVIARSVHTALKSDIVAALRKLFKTHEQATVQLHYPRRDIVFVMEDNQDKLTCTPIMESDANWIAIPRSSNCYDLFEMTSFYNEQGQPRFTHHPYTRLRIDEDSIISGQPLLDLLLAAQTSDSELPDLTVAPESEDQAVSNNE